MKSIAVILPSRGLIHSRTMESVTANLAPFKAKYFYSHNLPIPECFNFPVNEALNYETQYVMLVEEDMLFPPNTVSRMVNMDEPVVSVEYADRRTGKNLMWRDNKGEVVLTGIGCMLLKREVFEKMEAPYFRQVMIEKMGDGTLRERSDIKIRESDYGTQDVYFCVKLREAGYKINLLPNANIGHLQVEEYGEDIKNSGQHKIKAVYL